MMKKKLTAMIAVLLVCLLLFPTAAFAYASDGETTPTETPAAQNADAVPPADTDETVGTTDHADTDESGEDNALPFDTDALTTLLAGMDEELLEVLKSQLAAEQAARAFGLRFLQMALLWSRSLCFRARTIGERTSGRM